MNTLFDKPKQDYKPAYFNSTNLKGEELKSRHEKAVSQEALVIDIMMISPPYQFTATQVWRMLERQGHKILRDSVKRAMTNLTKAENKKPYLIKTSQKVMDEFGAQAYLYKLITQ